MKKRSAYATMKKRSAYATRPRDFQRMGWIKKQPCCLTDRFPVGIAPFPVVITPCAGPIEADHAGRRGLGRKAADDTCIPLCRQHHRERTDHTGTFRDLQRAQIREWLDLMIARYRGRYIASLVKEHLQW